MQCLIIYFPEDGLLPLLFHSQANCILLLSALQRLIAIIGWHLDDQEIGTPNELPIDPLKDQQSATAAKPASA